MMRRRKAGLAIPAAAGVLTIAGPALAYVGPGAGLSVLGALWGVLFAVFAALAFVVIWPVRRLMKRRSGRAYRASPSASGRRREEHAPPS